MQIFHNWKRFEGAYLWICSGIFYKIRKSSILSSSKSATSMYLYKVYKNWKFVNKLKSKKQFGSNIFRMATFPVILEVDLNFFILNRTPYIIFNFWILRTIIDMFCLFWTYLDLLSKITCFYYTLCGGATSCW